MDISRTCFACLVAAFVGQHCPMHALLQDLPLKLRAPCENFCPATGGHLGCSGPKLQIEFENEFPGPLGPGGPKVQNGVEKE